MSATQTNASIIPNCLVIPSASGSLSNCVTVKMPSIPVIILLLIISWVIFLLVAYAIYYFLKKSGAMVNYWAIFGILLASGLIINLITVI